MNWVDYSPYVAASWAMKYICKVKKECSDRLHSISWLTATSYSIKVIYQNLCDQIPKVNCHYFVWNRYTLPKNRVTIWLALQDRLKTKERLHIYGVTIDETCALCGHDTESSAHLFFNCYFSKECSSMVSIPPGTFSSLFLSGSIDTAKTLLPEKLLMLLLLVLCTRFGKLGI
ncbi:uncharacterized protein [Spinacia oleracea]|uniref:Reverse transcriptase zinc-binding domain-containing protein n=1 Tax=Spinacia oleracea TaxID=3562 RepID=A0ABM3R8G1_SPIOL|nr:uncharacterized protein LOC130467417 [Spinacia oleracea]